jgi:hypothetical protein
VATVIRRPYSEWSHAELVAAVERMTAELAEAEGELASLRKATDVWGWAVYDNDSEEGIDGIFPTEELAEGYRDREFEADAREDVSIYPLLLPEVGEGRILSVDELEALGPCERLLATGRRQAIEREFREAVELERDNLVEWTSEWPTEPGLYFTWDPAHHSRKPQAAQVHPHRVYRRNGQTIFDGTHPSLLWGPRIPEPEPPAEAKP